MASLRQLFSQTAVYGLSTILGRLVNFLLVPLHTRVLPQAEYGINTDLYVLIAFLMVLMTHGMETAFFQFRERSPERARKVYSTSFWSVVAASGAVFLLFFLFSREAIDLLRYQNQPDLVWLMVAILVTDAISALPFAWLRAEQKALKFAGIRLVQIGLSVLLNFYFLLWCPYAQSRGWEILTPGYSSAVSLVAYTFWANLLANGVMLLALRKQFALVTSPDGAIWPAMLWYGLPLMITGFAGMINELLDRQLIKYLLPEGVALAQLGIYSAVYKFSIFLVLFNQAFRYAAEPFFFRVHKDNNPVIYARVLRYYVWVMAFAVLAVLLALPLLQHIIGQGFRVGLWLVPILLVANYFSGINVNLNIWYKLVNKTYYGMYITGLGAAVTVLINIWLIPSLGIAGAAIATLCSYLAMSILSFVFSKRHFNAPYHLSHLVGVSLFVGLFAWSASVEGAFGWTLRIALSLAFVAAFWRLEKGFVLAQLRRS